MTEDTKRTLYTPGSIVRARGRQWIVQPGSDQALLELSPLVGAPEERTAILTDLEPVEHDRMPLPTPDNPGDHRSCRMLLDAARLRIRQGAGPFRSLGTIAIEPRTYQMVPLLMALRQDTIRLLIADDVGIGKTIESCLIAKELMERGEIQRMVVLCPPHLAEQWVRALRDQFHLDPELVLPGTAGRLERKYSLRTDQSLFDVLTCAVVSLDYIKMENRRADFQRSCPEFVIVDEAHTCSQGGEGRGGRQQRHSLLQALAQDASRHLVLVTATPHSGKDDAFHSLLSLLDPAFAAFPEDLSKPAQRKQREHLARHFVQRKRQDILHYDTEDTQFPERILVEETWQLSKAYRDLFDETLNYARGLVGDEKTDKRQRQVRWWTALGMLRAVGSSPAAAETTFLRRSGLDPSDNEALIDDVGEASVLDLDDSERLESDLAPGAVLELGSSEKRKLGSLAKQARALQGTKDPKLKIAIDLVKKVLDKGGNPILFCRFVPTANYVAQELQKKFGDKVDIRSITGELTPQERAEHVAQLSASPKRVLVCTDCLSEGIDLQQGFDTVLHYDLAWNPTRHEQREGRVDRYGQPQDKVRILTFYGDNAIDGIVLDVLLRKHEKIKSSLGISVSLPRDTGQVMKALAEAILVRGDQGISGQQGLLPGFGDARQKQLHDDWEKAAERESRSRTIFAQHAMKPSEVTPLLESARKSIGSRTDVRRFFKEACEAHQVSLTPFEQKGRPTFEIHLDDQVPRELLEVWKTELDGAQHFATGFELPVEEGTLYLSRTHPLLTDLADFVLRTSLDATYTESRAHRVGVIRTSGVQTRTTLLLLRYRFRLVSRIDNEPQHWLVEDLGLAAYQGAPEQAAWLDPGDTEALLSLTPSGNVLPDQARSFLHKALGEPGGTQTPPPIQALLPELERRAHVGAETLAEAHASVRAATRKQSGSQVQVHPELPVDILGCFIYLPA